MGWPIRDWVFWRRLAAVLSAVWIGATELYSVTHSDFRWFPNAYRNSYDLGPPATVAAVGIAVIIVACLGVPWIANRKP